MKALLDLGQLRGYFTLELMIYQYIVKGSSEVSPKGSLPQRSQQVITPNDHKSTWKLYPFPVMISGAMQCGVPMIVFVLNLLSIFNFFAVPISTRVKNPSTFIIKFYGLRSRQMILFECRCSIISKICPISCRACSGLNEITLVITSKRSSPSMNSRMKQMKLLSLISLWKPTIKGDFGTVRRIYYQFMMYWIICDFSTQERSRTFIAYNFSVLVFQQAYTLPKLPSRNLRTTIKSDICIFFSSRPLSSLLLLSISFMVLMVAGAEGTQSQQSILARAPSSTAVQSYFIFKARFYSNCAGYIIVLASYLKLLPLSSELSSTQMHPLCSLFLLKTISPFLKDMKSH